MKRSIIAALVGMLVSSAGWYAHTKHLEAKYALEVCALYASEVELAEALMNRSLDPSEEANRKTRESAMTIARGWIEFVNQTERQYPWVRVKDRLASEYEAAQGLLKKWEQTTSNQASQVTARKLAEPER